MLWAVLRGPPGLARLGTPTAPGCRPDAGTLAAARTEPHTAPAAQARAHSAGPLRASPAKRRLGWPRLSPAHARLPFLSACGSARLHLSLWWFNALLHTHLPKKIASAFSFPSFKRTLFTHPRFNARHPLNAAKKSEGQTLCLRVSLSCPQTDGLATDPQTGPRGLSFPS